MIDALLASTYGGPKTFALLALLYPGLDLSKTLHEDHIFPKSLFRAKTLSSIGISDDNISRYLDSYNHLPNLQLLVGAPNIEKLAMAPRDWVAIHLGSEDRRAVYLRENDLDGLPLDIVDFLAFFDERRKRTRAKLQTKLAMVGGEDGDRNSDLTDGGTRRTASAPANAC